MRCFLCDFRHLVATIFASSASRNGLDRGSAHAQIVVAQSQTGWQATQESILRLSLPLEWRRCQNPILKWGKARFIIMSTTKTAQTKHSQRSALKRLERLMLAVERSL